MENDKLDKAQVLGKVSYQHQDPVQHQGFSPDAIPLKSHSQLPQLPCPQIPDICGEKKNRLQDEGNISQF
jgi:hypothetical protein